MVLVGGAFSNERGTPVGRYVKALSGSKWLNCSAVRLERLKRFSEGA